MGSRIITLQRQARELGRLRTGTFNGKYPQRSNTWILTSHSRDYLEAAAAEWGGEVTEYDPQGAGSRHWRVITEARSIDAILPPGDPLSQAYEAWTRGGAARRCNGEYEQISDAGCFCLAKWGADFHQVKPGKALEEQPCQMTTRLSVILPDLPDLGVWRLETKSFYGASELTATVDVLKGHLGAAAMVPVALRIEQRSRVAQGKTKQFPVIALELRGATAGQALAGQLPAAVAPAGQAQAVESGERPALEAPAPAPAPARDWLSEVAATTTFDALRALWAQAQASGAPDEVAAALKARAAELNAANTPAPAPAPAAPAAQVPAGMTADDLWMACVSAAPEGWTTSDLLAAYSREHGGQLADDAGPEQLAGFLADLRAGRVAAAPDPAGVAPAETVPDTPESVWRDLVDGSGPEWTEEALEAGFAQAHDGLLPASATVAQLMQWGGGVLRGTTKPPAAAPRRTPVEPATDSPAPEGLPF